MPQKRVSSFILIEFFMAVLYLTAAQPIQAGQRSRRRRMAIRALGGSPGKKEKHRKPFVFSVFQWSG